MTWLGDLKRAGRGLVRTPGFSLAAVLTLGLAVGAIGAIFAIVNAVLLQPLPFPGAERIVRALRVQPPCNDCPIARQALSEWREGTSAQFEALGAFFGATVNLTGDGAAERFTGNRVTPEFWQVFAVDAMLGRTFDAADEQQGRNVVVLSQALWRRRFGAAPDVIGKTVRLNGAAHEVVGVMPAHFTYPSGGELWLPTHLPASISPRGNNYLSVVARLQPAATLEQATAALNAVAARQAQQFPDEHAGLTTRLVPLQERVTGAIAPTLRVLLAASAMVVLIACANLANLMLARSQGRRREVALRSALGGGRLRLLSTLLSEALLIAAAGAALGLALAETAVHALPVLAPDLLPAYNPLDVDGTVVAFVVGVAVLALVGFGLLPDWQVARTDPAVALQGEGRGGMGGRARSRARSALVVAEVALSLTLLTCAGLLVESLRRLGQVDPGVRTENVLTADVSLPETPNQAGESLEAWYDRHTTATAPRYDAILQRLRRMPEIESVAFTDAIPLSGRSNTNSTVTVVGREPLGDATPLTEWRFVSADYFATLGLPVVRGRGFSDQDGRAAGSPSELLVNEAFVRVFLADVDPVGQQLDVFDETPKSIVGVVRSARQWGLDRDPTPEVYFPIFDAYQPDLALVMATRVPPEQVAEAVRRALREVAADVPVTNVRPMAALVRDVARTRRLFAALMLTFSAVALSLAAVGLYGVLAYSVAQRRAEIGMRMSLGADRRSVLRLVLGQGLRLTLLGLVLGIAGALAATPVIAAQLYAVAPRDPLVIAAVAAVLLVVALLAVLVPAWRAAGTSPVEALRYE